MAEVLELIRGRLHESEAVTVPIPVPRSKSNFLRVILKRLSGGLSRDAVDRRGGMRWIGVTSWVYPNSMLSVGESESLKSLEKDKFDFEHLGVSTLKPSVSLELELEAFRRRRLESLRDTQFEHRPTPTITQAPSPGQA